MKSQFVGMLAAATIGLATSAHALNISVGNIIPPGGNAEQAGLVAGTAAIFGGASGTIADPSAELTDLSAIAAGYSGSVVVFALNTNSGTSLVVMSDVAFSINQLSFSATSGAYQTGGVSTMATASGGLLGSGNPADVGGYRIFAAVNLPAFSTGAINLGQGASTNVKFLSYNGSAWTVDRTSSYASNGSLEFNFQVLPVPAPALLAGAGLLGATVVRRRMKKN
jgi:hypothetical protein